MSQRAQARVSPDWRGPETGLLTWDDLELVQAVLAEAAPAWSAELTRSCLDEATIVVLPEAADDNIGPSFVLHRTGGRVNLDQFHWDEYSEVGSFRDLESAVAAMRARIARPTPDRSVSLH